MYSPCLLGMWPFWGTSDAFVACCAQGKKPYQHLVFFLSKLIHRPASSLLQHSIDDSLLEFASNIRVPKGFHQTGQRVHEMLHVMTDPTCAAADMPLQAGSHDAPPKPRTIGHGNIGVRDTQHTLLNEIDDFPIERRLQPD